MPADGLRVLPFAIIKFSQLALGIFVFCLFEGWIWPYHIADMIASLWSAVLRLRNAGREPAYSIIAANPIGTLVLLFLPSAGPKHATMRA